MTNILTPKRQSKLTEEEWYEVNKQTTFVGRNKLLDYYRTKRMKEEALIQKDINSRMIETTIYSEITGASWSGKLFQLTEKDIEDSGAYQEIGGDGFPWQGFFESYEGEDIYIGFWFFIDNMRIIHSQPALQHTFNHYHKNPEKHWNKIYRVDAPVATEKDIKSYYDQEIAVLNCIKKLNSKEPRYQKWLSLGLV